MCIFPCTAYEECEVDEAAKRCSDSAPGKACSSFENKASYKEGKCPDCKGKLEDEEDKRSIIEP